MTIPSVISIPGLPEISTKYIAGIMIALLASVGATSGATGGDIKYVDPVNEQNYIIFSQDAGTYYLHEVEGTYGGTYTETSESYNLSPLGYTIRKSGNNILAPTGREWERV